MTRILPITLLLVALTTAAACSRGEASTQLPPAAARSPDGALPRLVFFANPNGRPCQMQESILDDMSAELRGKVEVVTYRTTSRDDIAKFDQYGIRSLPALVLTDSTGREVRRATPGIQGKAAVRRLIGQ